MRMHPSPSMGVMHPRVHVWVHMMLLHGVHTTSVVLVVIHGRAPCILSDGGGIHVVAEVEVVRVVCHVTVVHLGVRVRRWIHPMGSSPVRLLHMRRNMGVGMGVGMMMTRIVVLCR